VFVLQGELLLAFQGGGTQAVVGGTDDTGVAVNRQRSRVVRSKAITDIDLLALDDEVLDILATWDRSRRPATRLRRWRARYATTRG
jgi:hypothetical protein